MTVNWWGWLPPWIQRWPIWRWSWLIEFLSGFVAVALAIGITALLVCITAPVRAVHAPAAEVFTAWTAHLLSVYYEARVDANGWEWKDVLQREVGILAALAMWVLV